MEDRKKIYLVLEIEVNPVHPHWYFVTQGGKALLNAISNVTGDGYGMIERWHVTCLAAFEEGAAPAYYDSTTADELKKIFE